MPDINDIAADTTENRRDIKALTATVVATVEIVKAQGQRQEDALDAFKEAVTSIKSLDEKVANMMALRQEVTTIDKGLTAVRHDLGNVINAQALLPDMSRDVTALKTWKDEISTWKATVTGGAIVAKDGVKILWALGGAALTVAGVLASIHFHLPVQIGGE